MEKLQATVGIERIAFQSGMYLLADLHAAAAAPVPATMMMIREAVEEVRDTSRHLNREVVTPELRSLYAEVSMLRGISDANARRIVRDAALMCNLMPQTMALFVAAAVPAYGPGIVSNGVIAVAPSRFALVDGELVTILSKMLERRHVLSREELERAVALAVGRHDPGAFDAITAEAARLRRRVSLCGNFNNFRGSRLVAVLDKAEGALVFELLTKLANTVCGADPRGIAERRADAMMAICQGYATLGCQCGDEACEFAERKVDVGKAADRLRVHVIAIVNDDASDEPDFDDGPGRPFDPTAGDVDAPEADDLDEGVDEGVDDGEGAGEGCGEGCGEGEADDHGDEATLPDVGGADSDGLDVGEPGVRRTDVGERDPGNLVPRDCASSVDPTDPTDAAGTGAVDEDNDAASDIPAQTGNNPEAEPRNESGNPESERKEGHRGSDQLRPEYFTHPFRYGDLAPNTVGVLLGYGVATIGEIRNLTSRYTTRVARIGKKRSDGVIVVKSGSGYAPTVDLRRAVWARDLQCTFPGCSRAVQRCDLDHTNEYNHAQPSEGGSTTFDNLKAVCRTHHIVLTHSNWISCQNADGSNTFGSPLGQVATTNIVNGIELFPGLSWIRWTEFAPGADGNDPEAPWLQDKHRSRRARRTKLVPPRSLPPRAPSPTAHSSG